MLPTGSNRKRGDDINRPRGFQVLCFLFSESFFFPSFVRIIPGEHRLILRTYDACMSPLLCCFVALCTVSLLQGCLYS